jgi:hemoglobin-like flavoprotein
MAGAMSVPLREQTDVRKLLNLFRAGQQSERQEYETLLDYVETVENRYNSILDELTALRETVRGIADRKNPVSIMVEHLSSVVSGIGARLKAIKDSIVEFAQNTLNAARDKGLSAIGRASEVLHIKDGLQAVSNGLGKAAARMESLEQFHQEIKATREDTAVLPPPAVESASLSDLLADTRMDFENLTPDELKATYDKLLAIGMNNDLTSNELTCLQYLTEEAEKLLPERDETAQTQEREQAEEQGEEI